MLVHVSVGSLLFLQVLRTLLCCKDTVNVVYE